MDLDIELEDYELTFKINKIYIDSMIEIANETGVEHDPQALANFMDIGAELILPIVNGMIPKIPIPQKIDDHTKFERLSFGLHDGYMYFELGIVSTE